MTGRGLVTAGQRVVVSEEAPEWLRGTIEAVSGERILPMGARCDLILDRLGNAPGLRDFRPVARGVWASQDGALFESVGGSGFTQVWSPCPPPGPEATEAVGGSAYIRVSSRWAPSPAESAAAHLSPRRNRALRAQMLLHYPALWSALAVGGMAPLRVSVVEVEGVPVLLAGAGGVGKSSLVADALAHGARATCDNLGVTDGRTVHGLVEPIRLSAGTRSSVNGFSGEGLRATHRGGEHAFKGRLPSMRPALVVVVRRDHGRTWLRQIRSQRAARFLVAGTYAAGELRRFWPLAAHLALAGLGPAHPPLEQLADQLTGPLPCFELTLGQREEATVTTTTSRLASLLGRGLHGPPARPIPLHIPAQSNGRPS